MQRSVDDQMQIGVIRGVLFITVWTSLRSVDSKYVIYFTTNCWVFISWLTSGHEKETCTYKCLMQLVCACLMVFLSPSLIRFKPINTQGSETTDQNQQDEELGSNTKRGNWARIQVRCVFEFQGEGHVPKLHWLSLPQNDRCMSPCFPQQWRARRRWKNQWTAFEGT